MKKHRKYIITAAAGAVAVLAILLLRGTFQQTVAQSVFKDLCDAFFVAGAFLLCVGGLIFATNGGVFDMLSFGVIKLFDLFRRDLTKVKYRTYYDYTEAQREKKRSFAYLVIVGAVYVVVGAVFLALYYNA